MTWVNDLAKEFETRNNKSTLGAVCGTVISINPLRVAILGGDIILNSNKLYICGSVAATYKKDVKFNLTNIPEHGAVGTTGTIENQEILKINDKVLCLPADGGQSFFIIDKVV